MKTITTAATAALFGYTHGIAGAVIAALVVTAVWTFVTQFREGMK